MSLRNEQLLMLDALAYYSSFSNGYRENEVWYMFKTVGEFVEAALANPDAYKTCFDGAMSYGDDELGMHDILALVKDDPELMNLEIVYPIEVDEATCSVCLINRGTTEVYVIYGGNYGQGEYQYDGNTLNTWVENAMGATEADTDDDKLIDGDEGENGAIYLQYGILFEPLQPDTDGNGVPDGDEVFGQTLEQEIVTEDEVITQVTVDMETNGNIAQNLTIESMQGIDALSSNVVGLMGEPLEFTSATEFDSATISFTID